MSDIEHDLSEIIISGRLPRKKDGRVDVYKIEHLLREDLTAKQRIGILNRLLEYPPQ